MIFKRSTKMKRVLVITIVALFVATFSLHTIAKEITDEAIAIVNDETITYSELLKEGGDDVKGNLDRVLKNGMTVKEAREIVLEQLILKKILDNEVRKYGIVVKDREIDEIIKEEMALYGLSNTELREKLAKADKTLPDYKEEKKYQLKKQRLIAKKIGAHIIVTDEEIQAYFNEHKSGYADLKQYRISEIIIPIPMGTTNKELLSIRREVDKIRRIAVGGASFAELAKKYSKAPDASNGGDMGFIHPKDVGAGFIARLKTMKLGEISEVIATPRAFMIFKLTDSKPIPGGVKSEDVEDEIKAILANKRKIYLFDKWLKQIRDEAFVQKML
jgi:peptidyl-prolyl cis-trans isomerase SurA